MSVRRDRIKPTRRKRCIFGLAGLAAVFVAVSIGSHFYYAPEPALSAETVARTIAPQQLHNDLDALVETAERIHPDLYFRVSRDSIATFQRELKDQIDRPMTRKEFYPFAARMAARFGDEHTAVFPPREEILLEPVTKPAVPLPGLGRVACGMEFCDSLLAIKAGELWFPFSIADFDGRGFVVGTVYAPDSPIAAGDSIVAIDGHSAKDLMAEFLQWQSGEKEFYRKGRALRTTRWNLWVKGMSSPYHVLWESARTGETSKTTIRGVTDERIREVESRLSRSEKNFSFRRLEGDVGYLEFRRMRDYSAFESFLAKTFQDIRQKPIVGLIVDLRRNSGGSTSLGDLLLSYITNKPYRMIARIDLKVSPWKKRALKERLPRWARWIPVQYLFREGRRIWRAADGDIVAMELPVKAPKENPLRYRGPVCVLIGEVEFSSAQKLPMRSRIMSWPR